MLDRIARALADVLPGAAGGLDGTNVASFVQTIRGAYANPFCIDAQGRLRTDDKTRIDLEKANAYLQHAIRGFSS